MSVRWESAGLTDVGRVRQGNEDAFLTDPERGIFLVADGMGGHAAGEVASALAREVVGGELARALDAGADNDALPRVLEEAVRAAFAACADYVDGHPEAHGMGTTLTACVLRPDGALRVAHIGDSRAYLLREGVLEQVTHDHTWVQEEVDAGRLSPDAVRTHPLSHVITRALSPGDFAPPDLLEGALRPGDLLLLCTDGLTGMVEDADLAQLLSTDLPLPEIAAELVRAANLRGGTDNVTTVLVRVLDRE